jgi:CubicO group peptidase (beta-lactamase class C family)
MDYATTVDGEPVTTFIRRHLAGDFLLWSPHIQREAFLNWDRLWATRAIPRGTPRALPVAPTPLDFTFESKGEIHTIDDLMRWEFVSGLLVVKDGAIRLERYAMNLTPERCWQASSMTKSLTSMLVGAALHDGAIRSVEQKITDWLPEFKGTVYTSVSLRDLLQMASGVAWFESTENLNSDVAQYIRAIAARQPGWIVDHLRHLKRSEPAGTQFYYNTGDVYLLGLILRRATGMNLADYCSRKIWQPMGCEHDGYFLLDSDDGIEVAGSCSGASLRDYARWGLMMAADGVAANGERILPAGWVAESTAPSAPNFAYDHYGARGAQTAESRNLGGYGYLWWIFDRGEFQARGSYGQWIYVSPVHRTVVVILGAIPRPVYMTPEEQAIHKDSLASGSRMRRDFIHAAIRAME